MTPSLSGQASIFSGVFFVSKSLLEIKGKQNWKFCNFVLKASEPCCNIDTSNDTWPIIRKGLGAALGLHLGKVCVQYFHDFETESNVFLHIY